MVNYTKTRSGRISKKPENYEPDEIPEDDFLEDEYDDDYEESADDEEFSESEGEDFTDEDEDVDENGNLKDFIVDDDSEED